VAFHEPNGYLLAMASIVYAISFVGNIYLGSEIHALAKSGRWSARGHER
jgi:hypothetical protein